MTRHRELGMFIPPNLSEMGADASKLEEILARLERYADERREIGYKLQRHWMALEAAKEADSRAYAEAIKAGKKSAPEEKNRKKSEEEREALERRARALDLLVEEMRSEARVHIEGHLEDWRRQSAGALEQARERYAAAIEELIAARGEFFATDSALQWLEDPYRKHAPASGIAPVVLNLDKSPGAVPRQQTQVAPVLDALRYELGQPERRKAREAVYVVDERKREAREAG
jgi:hypothetical protein